MKGFPLSNPLPELTNYAANAYNAKDGNFLGAPVFTLTYDNNNTVNWNTETISYPDQLSASAATSSYSGSNTVLMETTADYDRAYSASVQAEFSGVSYSGSASSSLMYRGSLFSSTSSVYGLNQYLQTVLAFERLPVTSSSHLDPAFVTALNALPIDVSTADAQQQYFAFFDTYGTHYAATGTMGGTIVMETDVDDSVMESSTALEVSTAISAGYEGMISSGSISATAAYSASTFLSSHKNQIQISTTTMGGLYSSGETIATWQQSIYGSPQLLFNVPGVRGGETLTTLQCISRLASLTGANAAIGPNIEGMLYAYTTPLFGPEGMLSSPSNVPMNAVQEMTGDGFLVATVMQTGDGDRSWMRGYDDDTDNPTTLRACASQHLYAHDDSYLPSASFFMPAPKGLAYSTTTQITAGVPTQTLQIFRLGNADDASLQAWQSVTLNTSLTASQDGFVLATIDWNNDDGSRGYIEGSQTLPAGFTVVAGASQHYYQDEDILVPCNSFAMPVAQNTQYQISFTATANAPVGQAYFVPLNASVIKFGAFATRQTGLVYQAKTDGFLVAYLTKQNDGDRGYVDLYSSPDQSEIATPVPASLVTSTSIHYYTNGGDTWVPCNTATIPVPRGNYYTVTRTNTSGNPAVNILWMPLLKA